MGVTKVEEVCVWHADGTCAHVLAEAVAVSQVLTQVEQLRVRGVRLRHRLRPAQQHLAPGIACMARAHCCHILHASMTGQTITPPEVSLMLTT